MDNTQFIETIKILDGKICHFDFHLQRIQQTALYFGFMTPNISQNILENLNPFDKGVVKCRVIYGPTMIDIDFNPYHIRDIQQIRVVTCDTIDYSFKFADRSSIQSLTRDCSPQEEIMIIKKSAVTDTSYSNIVFRKDTKLYTPTTYLLNGTKRQMLIQTKQIQPIPIYKNDILQFDSVILINAMMDLTDAIEMKCDRIRLESFD